jgi:epoxyqueuosine reductase
MNLFNTLKLARYGIIDYGYTTEAIPTTVDNYNSWVEENNHLPLVYLEGVRQEKRQSLKQHWPEFESALVFLFSYHDTHNKLQSLYQNDPSWNGLKLASYTLGFSGVDYHQKIKEHLIEIGEGLCLTHEGLEYKLTLDTHPVLERDLAMRAGIGWFGKNSMLINRHHGSFFIIGSLLFNKKIQNVGIKPIETDHCGQCTRCIDACPTEAIDPVSRTIVAKDCISTFTIEQFKLDTIPSEKMTLKEGTIFGCDICQDVCPWNKRVDRQLTSSDLDFKDENQKRILNFFLKREVKVLAKDLNNLSEGAFKRLFQNTSFERSGRRGLYKNIILYLKELNILS